MINILERFIGFSSGVLLPKDIYSIVKELSTVSSAIELSTIRYKEFANTLDAIPKLDLDTFKYISLHAPTNIKEEDERWAVAQLVQRTSNFPIVMHPDSIFNFEIWRALGDRLLIENMQLKKDPWNTLEGMEKAFEQLPEAGMCLDIGHALQEGQSERCCLDFLYKYGNRIKEIHFSYVDKTGAHHRINKEFFGKCKGIIGLVGKNIPIILEPGIGDFADIKDMKTEIKLVRKLFLPKN